ncbi:G-protein alpha subunit-domain-containing protein [Mycena olivaceomarginata]|nr:G-protein alpha subunit-domain-containing protein [Mycena olivaceomarginata]
MPPPWVTPWTVPLTQTTPSPTRLVALFALHLRPAPEWKALHAHLLSLQHVEALLIARLVPLHGEQPAWLDQQLRLGQARPLPEWVALRACLLPLCHVEALLIARLVPPHEDEPIRLDFTHADPGVRAVLQRRKVQLEEGPGLFLNDLECVTAPNYLPTDDDVLRIRLKTVGVPSTHSRWR